MTTKTELYEDVLEIYGEYMLLKLFVDTDDIELKQKYLDYIEKRRNNIIQEIDYIDAGVDIFTPIDIHCQSHPKTVIPVDYQIVCAASIVKSAYRGAPKVTYNTGFYVFPRSSISNSNNRLSNCTGVFDSGYRGHVIGKFDLIDETDAHGHPLTRQSIIHKYDRRLQICAPNLQPIMVELVHSIEELGKKTSRGSGGFGSTGI